MEPSNNLNVFRILYLVKGILTLLFCLFFIGYAAFGLFFTSIPEFSEGDNAPPFNPGIIFLIVGGIGFLICLAMGILQLMASKYIKEVRKHDFVMVVAILSCLTGILGILLGVFTIIELQKPHVKKLFGKV
ncbi:hypothetical protein ACJD0Z_15755 [Flavobacteriaceae bacterium M23B6Z8]